MWTKQKKQTAKGECVGRRWERGGVGSNTEVRWGGDRPDKANKDPDNPTGGGVERDIAKKNVDSVLKKKEPHGVVAGGDLPFKLPH